MPKRSAAINWERVVARGTPGRHPRDPAEAPVKACDARFLTWTRAQQFIKDLPAGVDRDLFRLAALVLAERAVVALCEHSSPWRDRLAVGLGLLNQQARKAEHEQDSITPFGTYALLHANAGLQPPGLGAGRTTDLPALDVLSQLARHLVAIRRPAIPAPYALLLGLLATIAPPLLPLIGS